MTAYPELKGKAAVITMAAQGIGAEIASSFARHGTRVAITSRFREKLQPLVSRLEALGAECLPLQVDPVSKTEVDAAVCQVLDTFGQIDILVNNAGGVFKQAAFLEISENEWDTIVDLNLKTVVLWMQAVLPGMIERRSGKIVNFGSVVGRGVPAATRTAHYAAAKAAVINLTRHVAGEVGPYGININVISPGATATPSFELLRGDGNQQEVLDSIPLRRMGTPANQAAAVLFLASDSSSYVTGANLDVNGGRLMV